MNSMQLGIVGCGDIAQYITLFAWLNRRVRIAAACDIHIEKAQALSRRYHIPNDFTDFSEMLSRIKLDAVYLAVPHHLHARMIEAAVEAGVHILVEKPITRTFGEGVEVVRHADDRGIKIGVNYQYRYDSGCHGLARAAQSGALGRILYGRVNLPWHRERAYFQRSSWHASLEESGGGSLLTQGSHVLDILLWASGSRPLAANGAIARRVFEQVGVEDLAMATVEMEDGALLQICSSMIASPEQALGIEVYGEKGTAIYTNRPWPQVKFRGTKVYREKPPVRGVHALQRSLEGFRAWVMEDRPYLTPARSALPTLAVVEAIYRSAQTGCRQEIQWQT
jgi:predicted dehydrogenase